MHFKLKYIYRAKSGRKFFSSIDHHYHKKSGLDFDLDYRRQEHSNVSANHWLQV